MSDPKITIVGTPDEVAERAADFFIEIVTGAIAERGSAAVALAGGSTPRAMNALLASPARSALLDWSRVAFYFGDERCVPPEHADSNFRMTRETLFAPLGIADRQIFRIAGEADPQAAADAYDATLRTLGTPPVFDLIGLGMGPDGHTASLFPGTLDSIDARRYAVANFVPKFNTFRVTITPAVLDAARHIAITAAGAEKADAIAAVLHGPRDVNRYPAQLVVRDGNVRWLMDTAAAAAIATPRSS